jgi:hypothetical protein
VSTVDVAVVAISAGGRELGEHRQDEGGGEEDLHDGWMDGWRGGGKDPEMLGLLRLMWNEMEEETDGRECQHFTGI